MGNASSLSASNSASPDSYLASKLRFEQDAIKHSYQFLKNSSHSRSHSNPQNNKLTQAWLLFIEQNRKSVISASIGSDAEYPVLSPSSYYSIINSLFNSSRGSSSYNQSHSLSYSLLMSFNLPLLDIIQEVICNALNFWQAFSQNHTLPTQKFHTNLYAYAATDVLFEFLYAKHREHANLDAYFNPNDNIDYFTKSFYTNFNSCVFSSFSAWTCSEYSEWLSHSPMFQSLLRLAILNTLSFGLSAAADSALTLDSLSAAEILELSQAGMACPTMETQSTISSTAYLAIDPFASWVLQSKLDKPARSNWSLIYSNAAYGHSWNSFISIVENKSHLLFIVQEDSPSSKIFGVYANAPIIKSPKWHGDSKNFLFTIDNSYTRPQRPSSSSLASDKLTSKPSVEIFEPSRINSNFQYLNYNTTTLPNGLGFGGQHNFFALWIDSNFTTGHSFSSVTYSNSAPISLKQDFKIKNLTVYKLSPPNQNKAATNGASSGFPVSAMVNNPDAVALLEMANKQVYSKDFKENQPT